MPSTLDAGGLRVAYSVTGEGPPLLLVHGGEGSHRMFDRIAPLFAARFTVIAYDQRDCGDTEGPAVQSTLADLADDAVALLHALGHRGAHVYGTSFGGRVAQCLALRHPEAVRRLVLASTWPLPASLAALNPEGVARIHALRAGLPESAEELAGLFLPESFLAAHPRFKDIFKSAQPQSERSRRRMVTVDDAPALDLRQLAMPTLLVAGALDRVVPADITLGMAALIPHARTLRLEGVGHAGVAQAPADIALHVTQFLEHPTAPETP
jgi:pimeloyl-ACP methyl ester carboxylesterase